MHPNDVAKLISNINSHQEMDQKLLDEFVKSVATRNIDIESVKHWLKAVHSNGISVSDTTQLTKGMMESGAIIEWDDNSLVVDKHSTGGVGDKMSLILAPALAACGLKVPMLAGRGLGHTGGTIDKLESIPGFNCSLTPHQMQQQVEQIGCCIAAQNDAIAPADGLLYAVRDVTNTIDSIPLITASIISKKAAEGLGCLVLDVKCGNAAFMQTIDQARALANSMVGAAKGLGINTVAQITEMDYPIGRYIGNSLEVIGSIEVLQGQGSHDTRDLVILQGSTLLLQSRIVSNQKSAEQMILKVLNDGSALEKFEQMCIAQGVDDDVAEQLIINPLKVLNKSDNIAQITALKSGYIFSIDSMKLAEVARRHGAGRFVLEDEIIIDVGFEIIVKRGQYIEKGQTWLKFHHNNLLIDSEITDLAESITVYDEQFIVKERLIDTIT